MSRNVISNIGQVNGLTQFSGGGTPYIVKANNGNLYYFYVDTASDLEFKVSTDGGISWSIGTVIIAATISTWSVWYDRWTSGISGDLIHVAYTDATSADTMYRTIDTASSDALSTQTVIFAGASQAAGGSLSICRAIGGNVYCATQIDAGPESGFFRLPNANVPNGAWDAARATVFEASTQDQIILMPGWAADTQDIMAYFWDASANEISRKVYDDSANSWAETSIATSMTDGPASTTFPSFAGTPDNANSRNLLVAWSALDTANADLRCWYITESAITEVTNVVLNSTDDQGLAAIGIDTAKDYWYVFYAGKSDGSETWTTALKIYYKVSQDHGSTWGAETEATLGTAMGLTNIATIPRFTGPYAVTFHNSLTLPVQRMIVNRPVPVARAMIGL